MTSSPWDAFPTDLSPVADATGPFPHRPFLEVVWNHRDTRDLELHVETVPGGAVALVAAGDTIEFAGQPNLTDYHSPLGPSGSDALARGLSRYRGATVHLDSLPREAVPAVEAAVRRPAVNR